MPLHWFTAYSRKTIEEYVAVLSIGPAPPPENVGKARQLELFLRIAPPRVYFYLGRTKEEFGEFAIILENRDLPDADVSPFDTGGLVRKIRPVCDWGASEKQAFLASYTWCLHEAHEAFALYPGTTEQGLRRYLACDAPEFGTGPHAIWTNRPPADIWASNKDWRCWTWEARWTQRVPVGDRLVAWTCEPAHWPRILEAVEAMPDDAARQWDGLLRRFVPGGVGALVAHFAERQAMP